MYADDKSLSAIVKTCNNIKEKVIPNFFGTLDWLKANKLSLSTVKTEFMLLGSVPSILRFRTLPAIRDDDSLIRHTRYRNYLGIIVDETLTWDMHFEYISLKVERNLGIMKYVKKLYSIPMTDNVIQNAC